MQTVMTKLSTSTVRQTTTSLSITMALTSKTTKKMSINICHKENWKKKRAEEGQGFSDVQYTIRRVK